MTRVWACICSMCKHTCLLCKWVYVNRTAAAAALNRHTWWKKVNRESKGHRFFNLIHYWFLRSPPHWCPSPLLQQTRKIERDCVSAGASGRKSKLEMESLHQHVCLPLTYTGCLPYCTRRPYRGYTQNLKLWCHMALYFWCHNMDTWAKYSPRARAGHWTIPSQHTQSSKENKMKKSNWKSQ